MRQMLVCVCGFAELQLGVQGQGREPRFGRVAERADRRARVGEEKPGLILVVGDHLSDPVRPAREEPGSEPRLECLYRRARLEPANALGEWHPQYRRPRSFVGSLYVAGRFNVCADPVLDGAAIHAPTMPGYAVTPSKVASVAC